MESLTAMLGPGLTMLIMGLALGIDAFSLGIGVGMRGIDNRGIWRISGMIAFFHIWMPLLGVLAGRYFSFLLGHIAHLIGGGLLVILGVHMIVGAYWRSDADKPMDERSWLAVLFFSLSVSVDSLSVGFSLGLFAADVWLTVLTFGLCGGVLSALGLLLGRKALSGLGVHSEALGGAVLLLLGVKVLI